MTRNREAGQALYVAAASLVVLLGFLGLGIDLGAMRYEKRLQQTAADAAAVAGASNLCNIGTCTAYGGVTSGAQNASEANGFTDSGGGQLSNCGSSASVGTVCVQVNNPPVDGPHIADINYVEARVAAVQPTYFMRVLGISQTTITARAVATNNTGVSSGCLYLLGPASDANSGLTINGGSRGAILASTCGIVDNGNFTGDRGYQVCSETFDVAGNIGASGSEGACAGRSITCSSYSACPAAIPAAGDPVAYLSAPAQTAPAPCGGNCYNPGTYNGGLTVPRRRGGVVNYTFNPGIYVLNGGALQCNGNGMTGNGVMFYLENGATFNCAGTPAVTLTAPTASNCPSCPSQFDGVLIYQDPMTDKNADTLSGGGNSNPDQGYYGLVVIWGLTMNGNDSLSLHGTSGFGTTVVKNAILVE
jgi:Putative Flp pilus-assembly TadE/G-like